MSVRNRLLLPATAVLLGLAACTPTPAPAPAPATATSAAPEATATAAHPIEATVTPEVTPASNGTAATPGCPSAKALERLVDLPKGSHFVSSSVECWKGWATAKSAGPNPGDGVYLFRYKSSTGWKYHSQGSGFDCKDLGIHEAAPFCQYP